MKILLAILAWISSPWFSLAQHESLRMHASFTEVNEYCPDAVIADKTASSRLQCMHFCRRNSGCANLLLSELKSGQVRCVMLKNFVGCAASLPFQGFKLDVKRKHPSPIVVLGQYCMANLNEMFAEFTFPSNTDNYKVRLLHVNGTFICGPVDRRTSRWGCSHPYYGPLPEKLIAITDDTRNVVVPLSEFDEDDGRVDMSGFIATTSCFRFHRGQDYRVYHLEDLINYYEPGNGGTVCFTLIVDSGDCSF